MFISFVTSFVASVLLTTAQPGMVMFHYPRWSPDGQRLVLTTNIEGGDDEEVWVMSRDGSSRRRLTENDVADTGADWLPDGHSIVFQRHGKDGVETLAMGADGSNVRPYAPDALRLLQLRRSDRGVSVEERATGDGQAVYFKDASGERRVGRLRWSEQPALSSDTTRVIFEQRQDPNDILSSEIAVWDSRTNTVKVMARGTDPSWSPDDRTLLFKAPLDTGDGLQIVTMDALSGAKRTLAPGVHPQFSPDGRDIVYMTNDPDRTEVYVVRADGSERRCLTCSWK